ncbi:MAG TPA: DnaD domain protein [Bacillales bacterium]|nr:DnaD domain protein [Bacillales bacterium]
MQRKLCRLPEQENNRLMIFFVKGMRMSVHWKSVLPADRYLVRLNGLLHDSDRKVLSRLYQPLMGAAAYSLYMTLWGEADEDQLWGMPSTHHSLMTEMQMNLKQIHDQRKKLEGLSLLKTYVKEDKEARTFLYQVEPPLDPGVFFRNDVLSVYLYNRIGARKFDSLKRQFTFPAVNRSEYRSITASFDEVFTSVQHSELIPNEEIATALQPEAGKDWIERQSSEGVAMSAGSFDFDLLMTHLSGLIVPKEAITDNVKDAIARLAFVYNIEPLEMCKRIERAYVERAGELEIEVLRKEVEEWYAFENDHKLPSLSFRVQPVKYQTMAGREPKNEEEKIARAFETYSPAELLEQIGGGAKPALSDLKVVEGVMFEQKLPPGVVNVLIDYVTTTNDMKLSRNYVEKIAGHWARKKVKTVQEAMSLARSEHQKYQNWSQNRKSQGRGTKVGGGRKPKRQEPLPKWMTDQQKQTEPDPEWESLRKQLEQELKDL